MSTDARGAIFKAIEDERAYQQERWGNTTDDTLNTPWMWVSYICAYATKWMGGDFLPLPRSRTDTFRVMCIKVAAIAVAAVESIDRQRAVGGCFYEDNR